MVVISVLLSFLSAEAPECPVGGYVGSGFVVVECVGVGVVDGRRRRFVGWRRHMVDAPAAPRRLAAGRCGADGWPVAPTASRPVLSRRVDQSSPSGGFPDRPEPIGIGAGVGESVDLADGVDGDYLPSAGFVLVFVPAGREAVGDSPLPFVGASSEKIPIQPIATVRAVD